MSDLDIDPGAVVTNDRFLTMFPEFEDASLYSTDAISMYLWLANQSLPFIRWGTLMPLGSMLWAAHFLALDGIDITNASNGKVGMPTNPIASKNVGSASISYDTTSGLEKDAGHWNSTSYGRRLYRFFKMAGMGGLQINGSGTYSQLPLIGVWYGPGSL